MLAAHIASNADVPAKATKQTHVLHTVVYKLFVDAAETELESLFDPPLDQTGNKVSRVQIEKARPMSLQHNNTPTQVRIGFFCITSGCRINAKFITSICCSLSAQG